MHRSQFDKIQYGGAVLKRNGKGAVLRPVITTHGYFRVLKIHYPDAKTHTISHECFLRDVIITVWADQFRQQQGELWFVKEEISDSNADMPWHFKGTTYHGWRQNQWQRWEQGNSCKMVCLLTGASLERGANVSLAISRCFTTWLTDQRDSTQGALLSAGRVTQMLTSLALEYSESLTPSC